MKSFVTFVSFGFLFQLSGSAFVDPHYKLAKWSGWGITFAWSTDIFDDLNDDVQAEVYKYLFSSDRLNLNIARYVIGATKPEDVYNAAGARNSGKFETFWNSSNTPFIWSREPKRLRVLKAAQRHGVDTFEAVAWSPPFWMTRSKNSTGNPEGAPLHDNFDPNYSNTYAEYLTEVVKHFHENLNLTFTSLCPFKNPSSGGFRGSGGEGCNMERETMVQVIQSIYSSLQSKDLTFCKISSADENRSNALETQKYFTEKGIGTLYSKVNMLAYYTQDEDKPSEISSSAALNGQNIWLTEWGSSHSDLPDMRHGLELAVQIISNIRSFSPSAWLYWQGIEYSSNTTHGLLRAPRVEDLSKVTLEDIGISSGYYSMSQFSRYICKGFDIVHVSDNNSIAAYNEKDQVLVIVTVNPTPESVNKIFDLTAFASLGRIQAYRTSPTEPHVVIPISNMHVQFDFIANSVTTFKISNAITYNKINLIRNGDFEENSPGSWFLVYGTRPDNGINGNYAYRGKSSGNIDFSESKLTFMQNVTVELTNTYHLSAWCSTTGEQTTYLGILVNGVQGPEIVISHEMGYQLYGLSVDATKSDVISIYMHSEKGNHSAQIDNVVLH